MPSMADWLSARFGLGGHDAEQLIVRSKDVYDGATPSANSVAAVALIRLAALVGQKAYADAGEYVLHQLTPTMAGHPTAVTNALAPPHNTVCSPNKSVSRSLQAPVSIISAPFRPTSPLPHRGHASIGGPTMKQP